MVLSVCQRVLHDLHDAEDAFQATFILLARNAAAVRKQESLASWLHGVAHRMASNARRAAVRRRRHERGSRPMRETNPEWDVMWGEVQAVLDEEIQRLPEVYRSAFVFCCLQNKSGAEAARALGVKEGTVGSRLSKARALLQQALARRGVARPAALAVAALMATTASAGVPGPLVSATVNAARSMAVGNALTTGIVSTNVASLLKGAKSSMCLTNLKTTTMLLVLALAGAGMGTAAFQRVGDSPAEPAPASTARDEPAKGGPRPSPEQQAKGTFAGAVVSAATDKPVKGVTVLVRRMVHGKAAGEVKLVSDAAGRFRIELPATWTSLPEAQLAVDVEAPRGFVAFPYRTEMGASTESGVPLGALRWQQELGVPPYFDRILLFPTKEIRGRLETPDGKSANGVDVVACSVPTKATAGVNHVVRRTKTDSEGRFMVEVASPGRVVLYYLPEHYAARYAKLKNAEGDLGTYKLEEGALVTGKLLDVRNQPLPGRWVRVGTPAGPESDDIELSQVGLGGFARWCKTGPGGTFRTAPLPAGEYEVSAHGINRWAGSAESSGGGVPSWDDLAGRERVGEPLEACIVPQKVVVRPGNTPELMLRAVPHVTIEIRAIDGDGGRPKVNFHAPYRYVFDDKEYFTYSGFVEMPTAQDGRLVVRVPRGALRFDAFLIAKGALCRIRNAENRPHLLGPNYVTLLDLDADKTIECVCRPWLNASLKLSGRDGSPLKEVDIDARQSPREPCYTAPVADGIYWIAGIQPDRPLQIAVKAKGYEAVAEEVPVGNGSPGCIELVLEPKK